MSEEAVVAQRKGRVRNLRTKRAAADSDEDAPPQGDGEQAPAGEIQRDKLEELKLLQKLRKKTGGTTTDKLMQGPQDDFLQPEAQVRASSQEPQGDVMGGFSKATAVVTHEEDPNMQKFIEQELAKRLGKSVGDDALEDPEARRRRLEAELYKIPDEYKSNMTADVVIPGLTTVITEVALPAAVRLRNIEETERMKRALLGGSVEDEEGFSREEKLRRNTVVTSFGKQQVRRHMEREELEEHAKRMKYVSERKPALPSHKLGR